MLINRNLLKSVFTHFNAEYLAGVAAVAPAYTRIATVVPSESAEEEYGWLADDAAIREWVGDRHIHGLRVQGYAIKNRAFERTHAIARADIEDGRLASRALIFRTLGESAALHPDSLVFDLLRRGISTPCFDGHSFFDTAHPVGGGVASNYDPGNEALRWVLLDTSRAVKPLIFQRRRDYTLVAMDREDDEAVFMRAEFRYGVDARVNAGFGLWQLAYGSGNPLDLYGFAKARKSMLGRTKDNGEPMYVRPDTLLVGPEDEQTALTLRNSETVAGHENPYRGTFEVITTPWLK